MKGPKGLRDSYQICQLLRTLSSLQITSERLTVKHPHLSVNEMLWATAWALLGLSLTSLPYLLGYYLSSPDVHFGGFVIAVEDGKSYMAKMGQGARGEWLFHLPYTSEDHDGAILFTFHLLLGKLARLSGLSLVNVYHLARLLCGFLLLWVVYAFISYFVHFVALRRVAFLLICFSSGLGWLLVSLGLSSDTPIDFMLPEAFTFLIIYAFPHLALAHTLMLGTFILTLTAFRCNQFLWAILAGGREEPSEPDGYSGCRGDRGVGPAGRRTGLLQLAFRDIRG